MPAQVPRVVTLPARYWSDYPAQLGVPDLVGTRLLCLGLASLFLVMLVGLGTALALDDSHSMEMGKPIVVLLFLLLFSLLAFCIFFLCRYALRAGGWFEVDDTGMAYGEGPRGETPEIRIAWADIAVAPDQGYDVSTHYMSRKALVSELWFWRRLPTGELKRHCLPLRLTTNVMRCLRYENQATLLRAVVLRLAAVPGIRFNGEVFVDAAIDPDTWQPMNKPRLELWLLTLPPMALLLWVIYRLADVLSPVVLVVTATALLVACAFAFSGFWMRRYPGLSGVIVFRVDAHGKRIPQ
jgi:hypothetical protein